MANSDINQGFVMGRLTRDAEQTTTKNGSYVAKFSLASTRLVGTGTGYENKTCFFDCIMFGKRAGTLTQYLTKGTQVAIQYTLDQESWEPKDGSGKKTKIQLLVEEIQLLSKPKVSVTPFTPPQNSPAVQVTQQVSEEDWNDLPF